MNNPRQATLRRVKRHDLLARWVVTLGGVVVIVSVLGILVMILGTALPLFLPARARLLAEAPLPPSVQAEGVLGLGIQSAANNSWLVAHIVDPSGTFHFVDLISKAEIGNADANPASNLPGGTIARPTAGEPGAGPSAGGTSVLLGKKDLPKLLGAAPSGARPLRSAGRTARSRS